MTLKRLALILLCFIVLAEGAPVAGYHHWEFTDADEEALAAYLARNPTPSVTSSFQPLTHEGGPYTDESGRTYIGREFTPEQFRAWFAAQYLGSQPYNGIGVHHTAVPTARQWDGVTTLNSIFSYYKDQKGWPVGKGPHIWLYDGSNPNYKPGQQFIYVATHPRHDGIGISYRNQRYVHIEAIGNFDNVRMSREMEDLYRFTIQTLSDRRGGGVYATTSNYGKGIENPSTWQGFLFHRNAGTDVKTCPGTTTTHAWFDPSMKARVTKLSYGQSAATTVTTSLRSSPEFTTNIRATLPKGTGVRLLWMATDTRWRRVRVMSTGQMGFVQVSALDTTVVDNSHASFKASDVWRTGAFSTPYKADYRYRYANGSLTDPARFTAQLTAGTYDVYAWYTSGSNRTATARYTIDHATGVLKAFVDQRTGGGRWKYLGTAKFNTATYEVRVSAPDGSTGVVIADAVKWVKR